MKKIIIAILFFMGCSTPAVDPFREYLSINDLDLNHTPVCTKLDPGRECGWDDITFYENTVHYFPGGFMYDDSTSYWEGR